VCFSACYFDAGKQKNLFIEEYFTKKVKQSNYKLKMTLDVIASFMKKINVDEEENSLEQSIEYDEMPFG
jgi:hypothetical protein